MGRGPAGQEDGPVPDHPRGTVLIVDNEPGVAAVLAEALALQGLGVRRALTGEEALAAAREGDTALVVCDLDMPGMSGEQVAEVLDGIEGGPPVLVMSGFVSGDAEARLGSLGCVVGFLHKPFDVVAFSRRVLDLLGPRPPREDPAPLDRQGRFTW